MKSGQTLSVAQGIRSALSERSKLLSHPERSDNAGLFFKPQG